MEENESKSEEGSFAMNRLFIIIRREYLNIVARKSFIVMTLLIPLISVLCMAAPILLMGLNDGEQRTVVVVDEGSQLADVIKDTDEYRFLRVDSLAHKNPRNFYESSADSIWHNVSSCRCFRTNRYKIRWCLISSDLLMKN